MGCEYIDVGVALMNFVYNNNAAKWSYRTHVTCHRSGTHLYFVSIKSLCISLSKIPSVTTCV